VRAGLLARRALPKSVDGIRESQDSAWSFVVELMEVSIVCLADDSFLSLSFFRPGIVLMLK
jgi:hypothetical protein